MSVNKEKIVDFDVIRKIMLKGCVIIKYSEIKSLCFKKGPEVSTFYKENVENPFEKSFRKSFMNFRSPYDQEKLFIFSRKKAVDT